MIKDASGYNPLVEAQKKLQIVEQKIDALEKRLGIQTTQVNFQAQEVFIKVKKFGRRLLKFNLEKIIMIKKNANLIKGVSIFVTLTTGSWTILGPSATIGLAICLLLGIYVMRRKPVQHAIENKSIQPLA